VQQTQPIQGEAGVILPPDGYLAEIRRVCDQVGALLIADEVQSGLGRAGTTLACEHWGVQPDLVILGKALGGGVLPLSAVLGPRSVLGLLRPGQHGSTFGGNPLACAIGMTVVDQLRSGRWHERAQRIGAVIETGLGALPASCVRESRCVGAWAGIDIPPELAHGRDICLSMARRGILMKETHDQTLRISPTLAATTDEIAAVFEELGDVLECYAAAG
jgi:ornithine--oxo-acid transaminase